MARNKSRYEYIELAVLRDSPLLQELLADVAASGKPMAQVAVQRLADYYRASNQSPSVQAHPLAQTWQPAPLPAAGPVSPQEQSARTSPVVQQASVVSSEGEDKEPEYRAEQARANAAAALDALDAWE